MLETLKMHELDVLCKIVKDNTNVPVCLQLNCWQFWNKEHSFARSFLRNVMHTDELLGSELICNHSSGASNCHAEWLRYKSGEYKLVVSNYDSSIPTTFFETIKQVDTIEQVLFYCATEHSPLPHSPSP